jgi:ABC-2 type transport system ATP-binding protein
VIFEQNKEGSFALTLFELEVEMKNTNDLVIETHGLSKVYKNVQALKSLDLKVAQHSIFGFLGPNGAGKTTTIKLLLGLARPTGGSGSMFGYDILRHSVEIRQRVGYLAQDPRYYESMTARDTLRFTLGFFFKGPKDKIEERIEETIELVGLEGKADRPIRGFSGGERQRLGIAQAQVNYPDLLILDEPAASLDPMGRHDVLEVMERLRKYTTIFYSTHILDDVQKVSDTVCILNRGELVAQAPIQELLAGSGKVTFRIQTRGDIQQIQPVIAGQPWVTAVQVERSNGRAEWRVSVSDVNAAEDQLLDLVMAGSGVKVTSFCQSNFDLEEVFMTLVGGNNHGKQ